MMLILLILVLFSCPDCGRNNEWHGIRPLHSNRQEVEKLFGNPKPYSVARNAAIYETKDGDASFTYSLGNCGSEVNSGWNVPELTVLQITYYPNTRISFSKLSLDMKKFEKIPDQDVVFLDEYINLKDGIGLTVDRDEDIVTSFRYFPNENDKSLKCAK